jgi:hypothetical protein
MFIVPKFKKHNRIGLRMAAKINKKAGFYAFAKGQMQGGCKKK